jgi:glycine cleavage system aminomethyltransferase T
MVFLLCQGGKRKAPVFQSKPVPGNSTGKQVKSGLIRGRIFKVALQNIRQLFHTVDKGAAMDKQGLCGSGQVSAVQQVVIEAAESLDVEIERLDWYLFQVAGPTSLALLEKLTGENLHDLKFLYQRNSKIQGKYLASGRDIQVEVARIGMARNLAYEIHGPMGEAAEVYDAVYKAGQDFGLERLGWHTCFANHTEGGFPQMTGHFLVPSMLTRPGFSSMSGSVDPADIQARFRTPVEVGWGHLAKPDHDYIGRKAVEAELANPKRTTVTLRWNAEDVLDVWASFLKSGEALPPLTAPVAPYRKNRGGHQDHVLQNGRKTGLSSGIVYSYYFREFFFLGCVDIDASALGTEVQVRWGDFGGVSRDIRATVALLPYLSQGKFGQPEPK